MPYWNMRGSGDRVLCERWDDYVATVPKYHEPTPQVMEVRGSFGSIGLNSFEFNVIECI